MAQAVKNLPAMQETRFQSLGQEDPLEKKMATHSSFLPGELHEQRNPVGYSPQGHKELDMTGQLTFEKINKIDKTCCYRELGGKK